ncbi:MAG: 16S rRNA (cytosine(1402)-N(4))-methyltransferase [Desulfobacterales bacterium]|nr:16S rRNA (cytosine(1402)-N(4))-methyltransferase [Desulfobacterales bacterium]
MAYRHIPVMRSGGAGVPQLPAGRNLRGRHAGRCRPRPGHPANASCPTGCSSDSTRTRTPSPTPESFWRTLCGPGSALSPQISPSFPMCLRQLGHHRCRRNPARPGDLSLHHLQGSGRGFSFLREEPLDMRMDTRAAANGRGSGQRPEGGRTAAHLPGVRRGALVRAHRPAHRRTRAGGQPIRTSGELARLVCAAVPGRTSGRHRIHPATRVFMALAHRRQPMSSSASRNSWTRCRSMLEPPADGCASCPFTRWRTGSSSSA